MPVRRQDKTTLLPKALLEQIKEQESLNATPGRHKQRSRREKRDAEKNAKKQRKVDYFANRPSAVVVAKRPLENAKEVERPAKRVKIVKEGENHLQRVVYKSSKSSLTRKEDTSKRLLKDEKKSRAPDIPLLRPQVEVDEDKEIQWLEYQLGLSGKKKSKASTGKSYKKLLQEDGLDDLLDGLEESLMDLSGSASEGSSSENDEQDSEEEISNDEEVSDDEGEWKGISMPLDTEDKMEEDSDQTTEDEDESMENVQEETTGAPTASKYVPPHLRKSAAQGEQKDARLLRQLKGQINKLSEQNISTILTELEEVYRQNSRNDVTTSLTSIIIEGITSNASLLDHHIALNAALVASLYRVVGIEFAAYFVQDVVKSYEKAYATAGKQPLTSDTDVIGKEALNLVVCIAELYNLEVISCVLIYDIIRALLKEGMGELEVELLLKILRISGACLRQDDPSALKDIIQMVSENTANRKDDLSSRTRFMIETLTNLKNNRAKKSDGGTDTIERMKKFLSGLSKKYHAEREPLRVTLEDLRSAETKGKWWLVGAGWAGDPLVDSKQSRNDKKQKKPQDEIGGENRRLLDLAKKQGMNTDIRRSIFIVLMNSDDYFDACDRLGQLNLTEQQQRDIIRVLLHCCGNERTYNPYYALVGQRLCEQSHSYKITAQFCLWDFLRDLGEEGVGGAEMLKTRAHEDKITEGSVSKERARNIAKLYAWWIAKGSVSLAVLKPLDFITLKSPTREFLDTLFLDMFANSQAQVPLLSKFGLHQLKHSKRPIEEIVLKAVRHGTLARGLVVYFTGMERRLIPRLEGNEKAFYEWCLETGKEIIETGLSLLPQVD